MKKILTAFTATAIGVLAVSGGASADGDGGGYPPSPGDTPAAAAPATDDDDPGGTLAATGSSTSGPLQVGGVLLVSGLGMIGVAKLRRPRATA
ncbi:MAG: hypothetical protein M3337_04460 [Actinomycetota bacterium]|nr:hypothetical protein [Actinomycetota bacterium]